MGSEQTIGYRVREPVEISVKDLLEGLLVRVGPQEKGHGRAQLLRIDHAEMDLSRPLEAKAIVGGTLRVDGAGLGLSIVTRAMTNQGGSLQICESAGGARLALNFQSEVAPQTIGASTSFQSGRDGTPASPPPPSPHYSI